MKLKAIELQGFKSFPDRIKLDFGDGITAVVGPNGSGKSNISDAVRWVLGEQSTKTLRGAKMEDVIFGGTLTRAQQGFAYVALSIDNTARTMPFDSDEVIVSRKLYRSGESEYRIGKDQVRLRDVHELFMDTGLGRDGYSIIGQGKIAEIVGAKSTQRREIFDEAAGISRYRYRKEQSQKQLDAAQENLVRLLDIVAELEARIGPLKVQSEKANKFIELEGEKRGLEISLWIESTQRLKTQLSAQDDKIALCRLEYERSQDGLTRIEEKTQQLYRSTQQCNVRVEELRAQIKALEEQMAAGETQAAVFESDIRHNDETIAELQKSIGDYEQTRESAKLRQDETAALQEEKSAQIERTQAALARCTQEFGALGERMRRLDEEIAALTLQRDTIVQSMSKEQLEQSAAFALMEETKSRLEGMQGDADREEAIARFAEQLRDAKTAIEACDEEQVSLENARRGYEMRRDSQAKKEQALAQEQQGYLDKARAALERAKLLEDMERSMEGLGQSVRHVLSLSAQGRLGGILGPVSRLIDTEQQYATAIETALGAAMQNIVVEQEEAAKAAIRALRDAKAGRATFLPLTSVREGRLSEKGLENCAGFIGIASALVRCKYPQIAAYLLGRTVVAESIDHAVEMAKQYSYRFRIVTLDGQLVNAGGSMTGGFTAKSGAMLGRSTEIRRLRQTASEQEQKAQALEAALKTARQGISAQEASLSGIDARMLTLSQDRIGLVYEEKRLQAALEEAQRAKDAAQAQREEMQQRLSILKEKSLGASEMMQKLDAMLKEAQDGLSAHLRQREDAGAAERTLTETLTDLRLELMEAQKDREQLQAELASIQSALAQQGAQTQETQARIQMLREKSDELRAAIEETGVKRLEYEQETARLNEEILETMRRREESEQGIQLLRREEKEISAQREKISGELARLEEKKHSVQSEYDGIITRLWDEYGLTRSQAAQSAFEIPDYTASQKRLAELKSKIKALGDVNVGAIEEYREVSERYTFLKAQVEDVETSRAELMKLIQSLTEQMRQLFLENFRQINEHFGKIFVQLFGGGRAVLSLTDESDPLESGIDITVQPPGKVIKSLSLLSGGEQAFIAIAIYFAILKVRPSPFCLLDEIEAALDDVNVTKFAQYLRTMSSKTQFIVITHRRGTMEEADVLYGVTMQEEGVSKLLRLNVKEIEEKLGLELRQPPQRELTNARG